MHGKWSSRTAHVCGAHWCSLHTVYIEQFLAASEDYDAFEYTHAIIRTAGDDILRIADPSADEARARHGKNTHRSSPKAEIHIPWLNAPTSLAWSVQMRPRRLQVDVHVGPFSNMLIMVANNRGQDR